MRSRRRRNRMETTVELNITAFLNLMVILVPFLLITAVFTRMTVLELNLPAPGSEADIQQQQLKLQLQVLVSEDQLIVQDAVLGVFKTIDLKVRGRDIKKQKDWDKVVWKPLGEVLLELKRRFPEVQDVTLLLDRSVSYELMIAVMDRVRAMDVVVAASVENVELFPNVSIGDIPGLYDEAEEG